MGINLDIFKLKDGEEKVTVTTPAPSYVPRWRPRTQKVEITVKHQLPKHLFRPVDAIDISTLKKGVVKQSDGETSILSFEAIENQFIVINYMHPYPTGNDGTNYYDWKVKINGVFKSYSGNLFSHMAGSWMINGQLGDLKDNTVGQNFFFLLKPRDKIEFTFQTDKATDVDCFVAVFGYSYIDVEEANKLTR